MPRRGHDTLYLPHRRASRSRAPRFEPPLLNRLLNPHEQGKDSLLLQTAAGKSSPFLCTRLLFKSPNLPMAGNI